MTDISHWQLHGPVRSMRSEIAEWAAERGGWGPSRIHHDATFDESGRLVQLDQRGPDDTRARQTHVYDDRGLLKETRFGTAGGPVQQRRIHKYDSRSRLIAIVQIAEDGAETTTDAWTYGADDRKTHVQIPPPPPADVAFMAYAVDGSEIGYGAPGVAKLTTSYDERDLPVQTLFHNAEGVLLRRVGTTHDEGGRVRVEEAQMLDGIELPESPEMSAEDREKLLSLVAVAFGSLRTEYEYDQAGRVMTRAQRTGMLGEEHTTYKYDEHGNPVEQSQRSVRREMNLGDEDTLVASADTVHMQNTRYEYQYDAQGNWTERVVLFRTREDEEFRPSNVERRTIEYYGS